MVTHCNNHCAYTVTSSNRQAAAGRQRLLLNLSRLRHDQSLSNAQQTIAADAPAVHIPLEAKHEVAFWPAHIWSKYNAFDLAAKAMAHFKAMAPQVWCATPGPALPFPLLTLAHAMPCCVVLYCTVSHCAVLCAAKFCWVVLCCAVLCCAVLVVLDEAAMCASVHARGLCSRAHHSLTVIWHSLKSDCEPELGGSECGFELWVWVWV